MRLVQFERKDKRRLFMYGLAAVMLGAIIILAAQLNPKFKDIESPDTLTIIAAPKQGYADLSAWNPGSQGTLLLDGEWEFYWDQLLEPADFASNEPSNLDPLWVQVPMPWTEYIMNGQPLPHEGYATYRLRVLLPQAWTAPRQTLGIYPKSIASAYEIWINGSLRGGNGTVGTEREDTHPKSYPDTIYFEPVTGWNDIVIQVANFHQRNSGIWQGMELGTSESISRLRTSRVAAQIFVIGIFFMMSMYYFFVYFNRRKEVSVLLFGGLCLSVGIRTIVLGESTALYFLPGLSWEWAVKAEYISISMVALTLVFFVNREYPQESVSWAPRTAGIVLAGFILFFLLTPARIYTHYLSLFIWGLLFPVLMYTLFVYILSALRRRRGSLTTALGFLFFTLFALNDMLFYTGLLATDDLLSIGLLGFLITQALNLSARFSRAIAEKEQLAEQLWQSNRSLERTVAERTYSLQQSNASLQEANHKMADLEKFRVRLLSNISHELGTPITSIKGFAKALRDGIITADAPKYANRIYERSILMERMIHDLIELSKLETNQITFQMEELAPVVFFKELFQKYEWEIEDKGIQCVILVPAEPALPWVLSGDPLRLEQVLSNLISNALRFTEPGGCITLRLVLGGIEGNRPAALVTVEDTGIGIEPELHQHIFERFAQARQPSSKAQGSGLGLAICREIVHYHHGEIKVRSDPGKGSAFCLELPLKLAQQGEVHSK
ncbi:ATP-binding protein [Paenibacillus sp. JSM ZJ436]|uniref:sensor histidine kinase n=1 Tax=Paenibacillus sp. JSM ZJ436 TaxID=3376190 RepID=UPI0037B4FCCE